MDTVLQSELEQYIDVLKQNRAKITNQRIQIWFLSHKTEHFTADDIIKRIAQSQTGQATFTGRWICFAVWVF